MATKRIPLWIPSDWMKHIDEARGGTATNAWIRDVIYRSLMRRGLRGHKLSIMAARGRRKKETT